MTTSTKKKGTAMSTAKNITMERTLKAGVAKVVAGDIRLDPRIVEVNDRMKKRGILPNLMPLPRWEVTPPADVFRVFERGGRNIVSLFPEIGNPNSLGQIQRLEEARTPACTQFKVRDTVQAAPDLIDTRAPRIHHALERWTVEACGAFRRYDVWYRFQPGSSRLAVSPSDAALSGFLVSSFRNCSAI